MAKSTDQAFESIRIVGGLISSKVLQDARRYNLPGQSKEHYQIEPGLTFNDDIGRYWRIAQARWQEFQLQCQRQDISSHTIAQREWLIPLLEKVLGYRLEISKPVMLGEREFPITHSAFNHAVPLVLCGAEYDLDRGDAIFGQEGRKRSAMGLLQEYLNAESTALWAIVSNGLVLRLLRDNPAMTRPAYIEVDFARMFEEDNYADFATLWLTLHATRLEPQNNHPEQCWLEQWRGKGLDEGERALDKLRYGVADALRQLGTGFVAHKNNQALRDKLSNGELTTDAYFQQVLRLVYRFLFLLTAEDRNVALLPEEYEGQNYAEARKLYEQGYSLYQLREKARLKRHYDNYGDAWQQLLITFTGFALGQPLLAQPALGGLFAKDQCSDIEVCELQNRYLYSSLFNLCYFEHDRVLARINYRDMDTEEFGSVYESLLELIPQLSTEGTWQFSFMGDAEDEKSASGHSRKLTGSYYTPDSLVQELIKSALEPVIVDRLKTNPQQPREAILSITVCDPACGSGHFLLAAARRLATELAKIDAGSDQATEEHYRHAMRDVVRHCIYGVDLNPMAVELCKTGLWLESIERGKPLSFLDMHIRQGNSLIGILRPLDPGAWIPVSAYDPVLKDDAKVCRQLKRSAEKYLDGIFQSSLGFSDDSKSFSQNHGNIEALPENTIEEILTKKNLWELFNASPEYRAVTNLEDCFVAAFFSHKTLEEFSVIPTSGELEIIRSGGSLNRTQLNYVSEIARRFNFFHWHISFSKVFDGDSDGFDVVIGNPPWDVVQVSDSEFFGARDLQLLSLSKAERERKLSELRDEKDPLVLEYDNEKERLAYFSHFCRSGPRYRLSNTGKLNYYALFLELAMNVVSKHGKVGFIVPSGLASDDSLQEFINYLISNYLESFYEFENEGFFGAGKGHMVRFALLTAHGRSEDNNKAKLAFQLKSLEQLRQPERIFSLSPQDIENINPNNKVLPIYQSHMDAELNAKIYRKVGVLIDDSIEQNSWGVRLIQNFITASKDTGLYRVLAFESFSCSDLISQHESCYRLYEAKMIGAYDHRFGDFLTSDKGKKPHKLPSVDQKKLENPEFTVAPYHWLDAEICNSRLEKKKLCRDWLLVWRDVTDSRASARTVIASIIPKCVVSDTLSILNVEEKNTNKKAKKSALLLANLNSIVLDYFARQKVGGLHLRANVMKQLPILSESFYSEKDIEFIVSRVLELSYTAYDMMPFAKDLGFNGLPFKFDPVRRLQLKCELDAYYAKLYGLSDKELQYILDPVETLGESYPSETFRVLKSKELKEFGEYRTRRLVLEAWDKLEAGTMKTVPIQLGEFSSDGTEEVADTQTLPDNDWQRPGADLQAETLLQLAAILRASVNDISIQDARLALLVAMEPRMLVPFLNSEQQAEWLRLNGSDAAPLNGGITRLQPNTQRHWGEAIRQLRGNGLLLENLQARTWSPGEGLNEFPSQAWAEGRAGFVMDWLNTGVTVVDVVSELPQELRVWLDENVA